MGRKTPIRIVGKRADFDVETWARAVQALALQLHRAQQQGPQPAAAEATDVQEPDESC